MKTCYINAVSSAGRIAVVGEQGLEQLYLEEQSREKNIAGNVYVGRVVKVLPGMQAAFVDIGLEKNGYLHRNDLVSFHLSSLDKRDEESISKFVREGEEVIVQVQKESIGTKGPKLTGIIELGGEYLVYLPHGNYVAVSKKIEDEQLNSHLRSLGHKWCEQNEGILIRTAVREGGAAKALHELRLLREQYKSLIKKKTEVKPPYLLHEASDFVVSTITSILQKEKNCELVTDDFLTFQKLQQKTQGLKANVTYYQKRENLFRYYQLEAEIDKLLKRVVWLKSGAYIVIEQTEAMTVIDVNTGKFAGKYTQRQTILDTNIEAAKEIAHHLKLRNLGGIILIDFINMKHESDKKKVIEVLQEKIKTDETRTTIVGFTELGILQITRKKVRESIEEALTKSCSLCLGTGRILSDKSIAYEIERTLWEHRMMDEEAMWIETTPNVIELLKKDGFIKELEKIIGFKLVLTENSHIHSSYSIRHIGSIESIQQRIKNLERKS